MKTIKIKILKQMHRYPKDTIVTTEVDRDGIVLDQFLRRRLKDAEIDQCVEVVQESKEPKQPKVEKSRESKTPREDS